MKKSIAVIAVIFVLVVASIGIFWWYHPTHASFNDRFVLGNTRDNIIDRYGQPYSTTATSLTYKVKDNTPELFMSYDNSLWYVVTFESGVAIDVHLQEGTPGG